MNFIINYPKNDSDKKRFIKNLINFRVNLILNYIDQLNLSQQSKNQVLKRIIDILS